MKIKYVIFYQGKVLRKAFYDYNAAAARLIRTLENAGLVVDDKYTFNPAISLNGEPRSRTFGILPIPVRVPIKQTGCWAKTLS